MGQLSSNCRRWCIIFLNICCIIIIYSGLLLIIGNIAIVYIDYKNFAKQVLGAHDIASCPPSCSFNLTAQWRDPLAVITVDNPSGSLVLLKLYTGQHGTSHRDVWVATNSTTHIVVAFDGGLFVDVYPLYPLSDAAPRHTYLPSGGNLTIRVAPPAIGGTFQFILATISGLFGLLATLGIIKTITRTPVANAYDLSSLRSSQPSWRDIIILASIYIIAFKLSICFYRKLIFFIFSVPEYLQPPFIYFLYFTLVNPISLFYFKLFATAGRIEVDKKIVFLNIYDLAIVLWFFQWLINPYPTIFKLEHITFISTLITFFIIIIIFAIIITLIFLLIFKRLFDIKLREVLVFMIPFILNEELVARAEFCREARARKIWVTIYPREGSPISGRVEECDVDIILVRHDSSRYMFSWSKVQRIEIHKTTTMYI